MISTILQDSPQIDRRRHIVESHTDNFGEYKVFYMAEPNEDVQAILPIRAAQIETSLAQNEMSQNIQYILNGEYNLVMSKYNTLATIRSALRTFYKTATGQNVGRMAGFLLTLTDNQLGNLFNITQTQVNQLKTRLQSKVLELNAVLSTVGE